MWIAKPLQSLTKDEILAYAKLSKRNDCPLSQTLTWAKAVESQGSEIVVSFNSEKNIGGFGFLYQNQIEVINGPILNLENPKLQEDIATFVYALTKARKDVQKVILKPRLPKNCTDELIQKIGFPVEKIEWAATKIINTKKVEDLINNANSKFRSEYNQIMKHEQKIQYELINEHNLKTFYQEHQVFLENKRIFCPSENWFKALMLKNPYQEMEQIEFMLFSATLKEQIKTNLLICYQGEKAYYLFGNEKRTADAPNISLNLATQVFALEKAYEKNIKTYDFNGFVVDCSPEDVYYGVNQFKKKFDGEILEYASPEFVFS